MAKKAEAAIDIQAEILAEPQVVNNAVDGCVIDWTRGVQVNPQTGQTFDFDGHLL